MSVVDVVLAVAILGLWARQLRYERSSKDAFKRVKEDQGPIYYR